MRSDKTLLANDMPALMTVSADHAQKDLDAYSKQSKVELVRNHRYDRVRSRSEANRDSAARV